MKLVYFLFVIMLLSSCGDKAYPDSKVSGYRPVYGADTLYKKMTYSPEAREMITAGKIYVRGSVIFQNDINRGIHIIDNSVPSNAHRVAFIGLPGNTEMAVNGNFLYANNFNDIVVLNIAGAIPVEVKRLSNMFSSNNSENPYSWQVPPEPGFYECPKYYTDSVIVSWVQDSVYQMCYRN